MGLSLRKIGQTITDVLGGNSNPPQPPPQPTTPPPSPFNAPRVMTPFKPAPNPSVPPPHDPVAPVLSWLYNNSGVAPVVNQLRASTDAVSAAVAAHTHNQVALDNANRAIENATSNGKALLTAKQTVDPTVANLARAIVTGGTQVAPLVVGGGVGETVDKALLNEGKNAVTRQIAKRAASAGTNFAVSTASNLANQAGQGKNLSLKDAAKSSIVPAIIGAALPGSAEKPAPSVPITPKTTSKVNKTIDKATVTPKDVAVAQQAGKDAATVAPVATPIIKPVETPVATGTIAAPKVNLPKTGIVEVDKAAQDIANLYSTTANHSGTVSDVIAQAKGNTTIGNRIASQFRKALTGNFSKEDNALINEILDGSKSIAGAPTNVVKAVNQIKVLQEMAHNVRSTVNPNIGKVDNYSTRIKSQSVGDIIREKGSSIKSKLSDLADLNLNSHFSEQRKLDKFVGEKKTLVGSPTEFKLKDNGNGTYTDAKGNVFKRAHATKAELEAAGKGIYEKKASTSQGIYHADTGSLKARAEALQELSTNPNAHGLYTQAQVDAGIAPDKIMPIGQDVLKDAEGNPLWASPKDALEIKRTYGYKNADPLAIKLYDKASNVVTQAIVLNPVFHGMNQLYQAGIAAGNIPGHATGWMSVAKNMFNVTEDDVRALMASGAGGSDYGAHMENLLSKMTGGATKINSKTMAAIELRLRAGLYKSSLESGMTSAQAAKNINRFLGDTKAMNETIRRATLFAHYFKTMSGAIGSQIAHPVENAGANINTALLAGITAGLSYGYQKATGNPNAKVRAPGELGLAEQAFQSVKDASAGKVPSLVTNRINPLIKEGGQQLFHTDLFTGQDISSDRLGHAASTLISPVSQVAQVTEGKKSLAEKGMNELGYTTPHAKGYQAAPKIPSLNTKDAITSKTSDPTGYQQQKQYFDNLAKTKASLSGDKATLDSFNKFVDRSRDPTTGQTIKNSPSDTFQNASAMATNDKLRTTIQGFEAKQPNHDPKWDLPDNKLKTLMTYEASLEGSPERNKIFTDATTSAGGNWIADLRVAQNVFFNNLPKAPGAKAPLDNPDTPPYPVFSKTVQSLLDAYNNADSAGKTQLLQDHGSELSTAWAQKLDWTNKMRTAQTGKDTPLLKDYPVADAKTQAILKTYNALPKGASRTAWLRANPAEAKLMQDYLSQASLSSLVKNASKDQFQGTTPDQALLKDIKNIGQYDIATTTDANGNKFYSVDPSLASSQAFGSNSARKELKYLGNSSKFIVRARGVSKVKKPRLASKMSKPRKVTIKSVKQKKARVTMKRAL